jgi:hypothetical protein
VRANPPKDIQRVSESLRGLKTRDRIVPKKGCASGHHALKLAIMLRLSSPSGIIAVMGGRSSTSDAPSLHGLSSTPEGASIWTQVSYAVSTLEIRPAC